MIGLVLVLALAPEDPTYAELSRKQGLATADRLMRDGKFLEAAVAYRNVLLTPGERDAVYAGIEIRRAHMLYPDFCRLAIDPVALLGSRGVLTKAADQASQRENE